MSVPTNSTNPAPPQPSRKPSKREKINMFSFIFICFMVLVGIGIVVTFATGSTSRSASNVSSSASDNRFSTKTAGGSLGFSIPNTPTPLPQIKIYVTGEVKSPGVYVMTSNDRIEDAIQMAGGLTDQADVSQLDLAQRVHDEMRLNIPKIVPTPVVTPTSNSSVTNPTPTSVNSSVPAVSYPSTPPVTEIIQNGGNNGKIAAGSGIKININTADATELQRLPGVGPTLSQRIVDYRNAHGPFHNLDDLKHVQGLTKSVVEKIQDFITF